MPTQIDYYKTLQIDHTADDAQIRRAYRRLAIKYHPERNVDSNAQELFDKISESYDVLSKPVRRAVYDQYGYKGLRNGIPPHEGYDGFQGYEYSSNSSDIFAQVFGSKNPFQDFFVSYADVTDERNSQFGAKFGGLEGMSFSKYVSQPVQEPPVEKEILVTLEELYTGTVKKLPFERKLLNDDGVTTRKDIKVFHVEIHRGWREGTKLTFKKEGDQGPKVIPADLCVIVKQVPHPRFDRKGQDLIFTANLSLEKALVGSVVEVKTLDDRDLKIPVNEVVSPDYEKIVPNEGMPFTSGDKKGNLIIRFNIEFPSYFSEKQKRLLKLAFATD